MEFEDKLDLLGSGAGEEVACQTCAVNPQAAVVTHRANQPIAAKDIAPRPRDLKPWLTSAIRSDEKKIALVKTIVVQSKSYARCWFAGGNTSFSQGLVGTLHRRIVMDAGYGI